MNKELIESIMDEYGLFDYQKKLVYKMLDGGSVIINPNYRVGKSAIVKCIMDIVKHAPKKEI